MHNAEKGFCLLEVIIVLSIVTLFTAIALPSMSKINQKRRRMQLEQEGALLNQAIITEIEEIRQGVFTKYIDKYYYLSYPIPAIKTSVSAEKLDDFEYELFFEFFLKNVLKRIKKSEFGQFSYQSVGKYGTERYAFTTLSYQMLENRNIEFLVKMEDANTGQPDTLTIIEFHYSNRNQETISYSI